ncbi:TetR/AcrR family transcriptional regulator (plasmid) [Lichenicola cladoniae]|uniref:TetR/AcrR family transcriptional regulator n=1 Tax=Lichenicola cladoniae TaxID=1484109 RepID=A0A6M8HYZ6_9PROT|nr:TetR/AcrR family transcriptional regulator [Lichenicola cladoniae]NPD66645.1 TetR/AcrR family transcriptional regulator [Acetobacteraceae bacterium]QKE93753.1 TetR/AcrR family transcriptional regulator [Lichenicola cladoniae]
MGTREKLVEAAAELLDQGGDGAVTLRAVAHAVGVSHNTPYKHFVDRAALLAGVAEKDFSAFSAAFTGIERSAMTAIDKLKAALELFVTYGEAHPARYRLLFGDPDIASRGGQLEVVAVTTFSGFAALVAGAQAAGELPLIPAATMTSLIYAVLHGLLDLRAGGRLRSEKGLSNVLDGVLLMIELIRPNDVRQATMEE